VIRDGSHRGTGADGQRAKLDFNWHEVAA